MAVLIKTMNMPKSCYLCDFHYTSEFHVCEGVISVTHHCKYMNEEIPRIPDRLDGIYYIHPNCPMEEVKLNGNTD